ncbi:unnamed protein product, partial [Rotaria magnacalcarata]
LTLSIQPSNIYDLIDKPSTIDFNNNKITTNANTNTNTNTNINTNTNTNTNYDYRYGAPMQSHDLDQNLE